MEALMEDIMNGANPDTSSQQPAPAHPMSKKWIAALMVAAALLGALIVGLLHQASGPPAPRSALVETMEDAKGEPTVDLFFLGIGRYRK